MWVQQRVTLELDGRPYHVAVEDFDRDRSKDRSLIRHGWRPIRVSDFEWEHARGTVLGDLYAVLGVLGDGPAVAAGQPASGASASSSRIQAQPADRSSTPIAAATLSHMP